MTGNVEALKNLYRELGGSDADVENLTTIVDVLNAISKRYGGRSDAIINPDAINNIADVAGDIIGTSMLSEFIERTLVDLRIPEGTEIIGKGAFRGNSNLKSVVIPDSVRTIDEGAFNGCTRLENVVIPGSVTTIGALAFASVAGTIYCRFSEGAVSGAPWGATGTIVYDYNG